MKSFYLSANLYNKIYAYMTYENVLALRTSLETGMRIDDVLCLKFANLIGRKICYTAKKTNKKDTKVVSQSLMNQLRKQLVGNDIDEYVFKHRTKQGAHRTRQAVWKNIKQAVKHAGIEGNVTPHSARKTYAVDKFHNDGLNATQKALQHDNASTTMIYAFADILSNTGQNKSKNIDYEVFADLVADKVIEKLIKRFNLPNECSDD